MPKNSPGAAVIGGAYVDMAVRCSRFPPAGRTVSGSSLAYTTTGPGPNQAIQAALCGCQVSLIGKIGTDPFAEVVNSTLAGFGVNTDFLYTARAKNTGAVVTLVNTAGENAGCICSGANSSLTADEINSAEQVISQADVCLIHGRLPQEAVIAAVNCAKIHNVKVILNPASPIDQKGKENRRLPIEYYGADILILNLYEAGRITEQLDAGIRTAKLIGSDLLARGAGAVVITMGRNGCVVIDRTGVEHIAALEVELVDQTCAGDAFAGALAAYCSISNDIKEAGKFASAAGALACTKFGSTDALPAKAEIIELLQKQDKDNV